MNDERERHEGDDPVADFFARERASIRPEPADDLRWQRIVREARRGRQSRWLATVGGVAAAGVVAATLAFGPQVADTLRGTPQPGPAAPASQSAARSAAPTPHVSSAPLPNPTTGSSTSSPTGAQSSTASASPEAGTFVAGSLSNSGNKRLYLLGNSQCGDSRCPVLQTSSDNGRTWEVVHTFSAQDTDLTQVRFANPEVGWAYGTSSIRMTRDGGRTWHGYPFPGDAVLDLESNGKVVIVTSSSQCASGTCSGVLRVSVTPIGGAAATQTAQFHGGLQRADIATSREHTVIDPRWPTTASRVGGPWTLAGADLVGTGPVSNITTSCIATGKGLLTVGSNDPGRLVSLCPVGGTGTFEVHSSDDGGSTWTRQGNGLSLPGSGPVSLAAASKSHLLAMRGDTLLVSTDAGASWHTPAGPPPTPKQGWAWIGAPGGTQLYAIALDQGGYWVSYDGGEHWTEVTPGS
jgi:photosystem II stability/assembly factor-like uncharacterized protein